MIRRVAEKIKNPSGEDPAYRGASAQEELGKGEPRHLGDETRPPVLAR